MATSRIRRCFSLLVTRLSKNIITEYKNARTSIPWPMRIYSDISTFQNQLSRVISGLNPVHTRSFPFLEHDTVLFQIFLFPARWIIVLVFVQGSFWKQLFESLAVAVVQSRSLTKPRGLTTRGVRVVRKDFFYIFVVGIWFKLMRWFAVVSLYFF